MYFTVLIFDTVMGLGFFFELNVVLRRFKSLYDLKNSQMKKI